MEAAKHIILKGGDKMPRIGFGTWKIENRENDIDVLKHAITIGYRHFDTAELYECEDVVGEAIKDSIDSGATTRADFFITTKVWPSHYADVGAALDVSLKKLQTDYVDMFLLHFPVPPIDETTKTFARLPLQKIWA